MLTVSTTPQGTMCERENPIFVSLLDRTLALCVHKDISEAAISNLVSIITGVPVHDQRICRVSRTTGTWVRNEGVLVLFRLRGGVAWNCIPLHDQTADFLRTNFWPLHASMGHATTAQITLLFEGLYISPPPPTTTTPPRRDRTPTTANRTAKRGAGRKGPTWGAGEGPNLRGLGAPPVTVSAPPEHTQ